MTAVSSSDRRLAFRRLLERPQVIRYGSVWDAVSARLAESLGFEIGMLGGSIASHAVLGAPDIVLLTLSDFVEQSRRITRASPLPLLVDADHGYGNALNVGRTVQDLEAAGVAGLTIEDTVLPRRYGGGEGELITVDEFGAKLRAAVAARSDPALVVVGRTGAMARGGFDETLSRVRVASESGVDALFVLGVTTKEQVAAISDAAGVPLVLNAAPASYEELASLRVRIILQGHLPYFVAMKALYEALKLQRDGGPNAVPRESAASAELQAVALDEADYRRWAREFLGIE